MIDLKRFRKDRHIKQSEVCEVLGVSQPFLSAIEMGKSPLNEEKFQKLYNHYGDVLLEYKLTERPIIIGSEINGNSTNRAIFDHVIKYYDVESADCLNVFEDDKAVYKKMVIPGFEDCDFAINVLGDSMYPELKSGQIALLKMWKESYIEFGYTYLVVTHSGHRMLKRLRAASKKDEVICESVNKLYDSIELKKSDIKALYLLKGYIERCAM